MPVEMFHVKFSYHLYYPEHEFLINSSTHRIPFQFIFPSISFILICKRIFSLLWGRKLCIYVMFVLTRREKWPSSSDSQWCGNFIFILSFLLLFFYISNMIAIRWDPWMTWMSLFESDKVVLFILIYFFRAFIFCYPSVLCHIVVIFFTSLISLMLKFIEMLWLQVKECFYQLHECSTSSIFCSFRIYNFISLLMKTIFLPSLLFVFCMIFFFLFVFVDMCFLSPFYHILFLHFPRKKNTSFQSQELW